MIEPIALAEVRFLKYHQGMGADIGSVLHVSAEWAKAAVAHGVVEYVTPHPEEPKAEAKPDI